MKRIYIFIALVFMSLCSFSSAQERPSERSLTEFLESYEGTKGVDFINLKGMLLNFAKPALKKTPMKDMLDEIDNVCVFNMGGASKTVLKAFDKELDGIMAGYEKVVHTKEGKTESTIFLMRKDDASISELVVYSGNEDIAIVVMKGEIPIALLEEMAAQAK